MKKLVLSILALVTAVPLVNAQQNTASGTSRPNVVLILRDDHRYHFMGFHEGVPELLRSRNMERLAHGGMLTGIRSLLKIVYRWSI